MREGNGENFFRAWELANGRAGETPAMGGAGDGARGGKFGGIKIKFKIKVTGFRLGGRNDVKFKSGEREGAEAQRKKKAKAKARAERGGAGKVRGKVNGRKTIGSQISVDYRRFVGGKPQEQLGGMKI